ncbi:MAG: hypothetical protein MJ227_03925 [Bacilli bacterium]|nr:hypothetical protein [Bacilli bacterium]
MSEPKLSEVKKYLSSIIKINKKYVTTERLSKVVGIYPEVINETLNYFNPMIKMDPEYNLMELVPTLKKFVSDKEDEKTNSLVKKPQPQRITEHYDSIGDFVYRKMTVAGGLLDKNINLSDLDLRILKKLINEEQQKRKKK